MDDGASEVDGDENSKENELEEEFSMMRKKHLRTRI